jgi:hypothetical protein
MIEILGVAVISDDRRQLAGDRLIGPGLRDG